MATLHRLPKATRARANQEPRALFARLHVGIHRRLQLRIFRATSEPTWRREEPCRDSSEGPSEALFDLLLLPVGSQEIDDFEHVEAVHHQTYAPTNRAPENLGMLESEKEPKNGNEKEIHENVGVKLLDALYVLNRVFLISGDWGCIRHRIFSRFKE